MAHESRTKNVIMESSHTKNIGLEFSLIDHFPTTDDNLYNTAGSLKTNASNHFFIHSVRKKPKSIHPKSKQIGRLTVDW